MSKGTEVLENIKKEEDSSDKKLAGANADASKAIEQAKKRAQSVIDEAIKDAEKRHEAAMQKAMKEADARRSKILADAKKRAQRIKKASSTTVLNAFKKAIKERFGV